ncbi:hypothetical protein SARC_10904 [Sphaeroforma arctica JP610]|uniref:ABC transporter domain-containing protein n=1 Tax=Sphaeroforma arctica JP610 TaxID=667725 RepID=A0A0L0FKS2_9EUKA|nr:hypothetical protein SARC_10904 [Sphaeroforma arctica JP610]KNC76603.1 hypothetical protein SARC_10904 [Sphaeroforma arctica JP610]|eukprot:XP_014150505.1 hypothetical protein SARC_10904 [Sphaeroforma arctica JP610]
MWEKIRGLSMSGFPKSEMEDKFLLTNVTGTIKPNTMTALMGPSGAGKSTLLDVLAMRKNTGTIEGELLVNGSEPGAAYKRLVGYVEQRDILLPFLTPKEILFYTARIRLPRSVGTAYINERVAKVINELGLDVCQDTMIGNAQIRGISGGQAKRVNIGIELITDPRVLFLDEPTTGLDSATALEVMMVMRDITNRGRTTIATIHQPSTDVFNLFDKLCLLVAGNVVYLGPADSAVSYFEDIGFVYDDAMNPADYLIAVTGSGTGNGEKMVEGPDLTLKHFVEKYQGSQVSKNRMESTLNHKQSQLQRLELRRKSLVNTEPVRFINPSTWNTWQCLLRTVAGRKRDKGYWLSRFARVIFMTFLLCTTFPQQDKSCSASYNIVSVLNFGVMVFGFGAMSFLPGLMQTRNFFYRERQAQAYQVSSFYASEFLSELPVTIAQATLWTALNYPIIGLRASVSAGLLYFVILVISSEVGFAIAQCFTYLAKDMEQAAEMMLPVVLLNFLFAGFYIQRPLIPDYFIWCYYISFLGYAFSAFGINQWPSGECDGWQYCQGGTSITVCNDVIQSQWGIGVAGYSDQLWISMVGLCGLWVVWRILAYLALRFCRHDKR